MVTKRLEMRIEEDRLARLERVAKEEGESISEIARRFMDRGYEDWMKERRKEAVRRMSELQIEDVPDPEELSRQLDATHDLPDLY
jgi:hypothetical protein